MYALPIIFLVVSFSSTAPASVKLCEKDTGQTVEMSVGDVLEVALKGNPTMGYTWSAAFPDKGILKQVGETKFEPDRKTRGSGGNIILSFEAAKVGKISLKLIYHRPFEKNKPPIKTFEVKVIIR